MLSWPTSPRLHNQIIADNTYTQDEFDLAIKSQEELSHNRDMLHTSWPHKDLTLPLLVNILQTWCYFEGKKKLEKFTTSNKSEI